ncbi:MAG: hypothetical protein KHY19_16955 [Coprobacillus cateniformis]|nr:hypothetical protein [Coprobacillus cateniformis]
MAEIKVLDLNGLSIYTEESKKVMDTKDAEILKQSKAYADGLGSNYDPAGTAQTKVDALANGQVTTNKNDIAGLKNSKANKATTLSGYGIADAYTKTQTTAEINKAVANAGHLKRTIVTQLPAVESADEHTIYMVAKNSGSGNNVYDEYFLVVTGQTGSQTKKFEKIGDSAVNLTNYATKNEVATAKQEAINAASTDASTKSNKALADAKSYADGLGSKYATAAQGSKADTALQKASITSGTANGTISVSGTDVIVKGLGSAAYTASTVYEKAGAVAKLEQGQVTTNKNNIAQLKTDVDKIKATTYVAITEEEIKALFA